MRVTLTIFAAGEAGEKSFTESWHVDEGCRANTWHKISFRRHLRGLEVRLSVSITSCRMFKAA